MNTVLVYLLISIGSNGGYSARPTLVLERFATKEDCEAVEKWLNGATPFSNFHRCVPAKVVKP